MSASTFVARVMAWWLRLFFRGREVPSAEPQTVHAMPYHRRPGTYRVIPAGCDREAYRKVMRAAQKMQRKIEAGKLTEAEALKALGVEVE